MNTRYFDNAATTQIREEVVISMSEVLKNSYGNPSSPHSFGRTSKTLVESSRKTIADYLNVSASEIVFTSSGTEADNLVLISAVRDLKTEHIVTSKIEHHAVLNTVNRLANDYSIKVSFVDIDENGDVDYNSLEVLLKTEAKTLVSLMHVNNEIGNILDLGRVANLCKENNALFHTDAVQSIGCYELDLQEIPIDFLVASAHKFHGPKGIGFAFVRKNTGLKPLFFGGNQERGLRAGTEAVHNIVGLKTALNLAYKNLDKEKQYIEALKKYFVSEIKNKIPEISFNGNSGNMEKSAYTIVNTCLPIKREISMLLFQLDLKGIACSRGSACQSGALKGSHVLAEILSDADLKKPSIRFSFSIYNTKESIDYAIDVLKGFI